MFEWVEKLTCSAEKWNIIDSNMVVPGEKSLRKMENHCEREILISVAGKVSFAFKETEYEMRPFDIIFLDSWIPHQWRYSLDDNDFRHIWIHFHRKKLFAIEISRSGKNAKKWEFIYEFHSDLLTLLNRRWDIAMSIADPMKRKNIFSSMIRVLLEELSLKIDSSSREQEKRELSVLVANYISVNFGRNCSMNELEKFTGFSRYYIMKIFKSKYDMTIGEYINRVRRGFVSRALSHGMSQKEISVQLGFASPASFWLWLKRDSERNNYDPVLLKINRNIINESGDIKKS